MDTDELIPNEEVEVVQPKIRKESFFSTEVGRKICHIVIYSILFIAVAVLYILHFFSPKSPTFIPKEVTGTPGSGEIVFVNLDTINAKYELVTILTGDIKVEMAKQDAIYSNKENAFQKKYSQFQENMNAGVLTQVQVENAQKQLMQEYQQLEDEKDKVFNNLQARQAAALLQIYDSLQAAVKRINIQRNASYVISYQSQSPFLLVADPTQDITDYVLFELNRSYKK